MSFRSMLNIIKVLLTALITFSQLHDVIIFNKALVLLADTKTRTLHASLPYKLQGWLFPRDRRKSFLAPRPLSVSFDRASAETRISLSHRGSRELQKGWRGFRLIGCGPSTATALEGHETALNRSQEHEIVRSLAVARTLRPRGRGNFSIRLTRQALKALQRNSIRCAIRARRESPGLLRRAPPGIPRIMRIHKYYFRDIPELKLPVTDPKTEAKEKSSGEILFGRYEEVA